MEPWALLQLADSAFPTDGFALATGLYAARELGRVRTADDVVAFAEEALWASGPLALPFVRAARADPTIHAAVDAVCEASLRAPSANRASRDQGQAFLRAAAIFSPATSRLAEEARRQHLAGHLAPAFGAVLGLLGGSDDDACRLFLFVAARAIFSASMRLGVIGVIESQALLARTGPVIAAVVAASSDLSAYPALALQASVTPAR